MGGRIRNTAKKLFRRKKNCSKTAALLSPRGAGEPRERGWWRVPRGARDTRDTRGMM